MLGTQPRSPGRTGALELPSIFVFSLLLHLLHTFTVIPSKELIKTGIVVHAWTFSSQEAEAGASML